MNFAFISNLKKKLTFYSKIQEKLIVNFSLSKSNPNIEIQSSNIINRYLYCLFSKFQWKSSTKNPRIVPRCQAKKPFPVFRKEIKIPTSCSLIVSKKKHTNNSKSPFQQKCIKKAVNQNSYVKWMGNFSKVGSAWYLNRSNKVENKGSFFFTFTVTAVNIYLLLEVPINRPSQQSECCNTSCFVLGIFIVLHGAAAQQQ